MDGGFNEAYYSTAAQVIPVFYLVMLGQSYWWPRTSNRSGWALINVAVTGFVVVAEVVCISALQEREEPSNLGDFSVLLGFSLPLLRVALVVGVDAWIEAHSTIPRALRTALSWVFTGGALALLIASFFVDPSDVLIGVLALGFFIAFIVGGIMVTFGTDSGGSHD